MVRSFLGAVLVAVVAAPGFSQSPGALPLFQKSLSGIHTQVLKANLSAQSIASLSRIRWSADKLEREARNLRWELQRVARKARSASRGRRGRRDPFLANDVRRLVSDLRRHSRATDRLKRETQRLERIPVVDKSLLFPAQNALSAVRRWDSSAGWLSSEARFASSDLRRAGFSMEAWDIERETRDAERDARDSESALNSLIRKLRSIPEGEG